MATNSTDSSLSERERRNIDTLKNLMRGVLLDNFLDPKTVELIVNADQSIWVEKLGQPLSRVGLMNDASCTEAIISIVASMHNTQLSFTNPICEGEFPLDGSRFEGLIPPAVSQPIFSIRKKASMVFSLDDYVKNQIMTPQQRQIILQAVTAHRNILVCGGTGSGKTTLINAIIDAMVKVNDHERVVIIEDTGEIQCAAKNYVQLRSTDFTSMTQLLRATLRLRPDRILVGEVRGAEALDLLDAWNTGHPGGCATLHANDAISGLSRLNSLISRNPQHPQHIEPLIGEAVHVVVCIARQGHGRKIHQIVKVNGWDVKRNEFILEKF